VGRTGDVVAIKRASVDRIGVDIRRIGAVKGRCEVNVD